MHTYIHTHTHTHSRGKQALLWHCMISHFFPLSLSLSLPAEIVLTKEREKEGEGWRGWGRGCMCCSVVTRRGRARGGGRRELEGEQVSEWGRVGEKDRVPEESTSLTHTHAHTLTHSVTHTFMSAPSVLLCGIVDYFLYWATHQGDPGMTRSVTIYPLNEKDCFRLLSTGMTMNLLFLVHSCPFQCSLFSLSCVIRPLPCIFLLLTPLYMLYFLFFTHVQGIFISLSSTRQPRMLL